MPQLRHAREVLDRRSVLLHDEVRGRHRFVNIGAIGVELQSLLEGLDRLWILAEAKEVAALLAQDFEIGGSHQKALIPHRARVGGVLPDGTRISPMNSE